MASDPLASPVASGSARPVAKMLVATTAMLAFISCWRAAAIVGSNGVLNRVSEDGVLSDWFRHPQKRFGTSHRIINMVVGLQILTIFLSRGDVTFLANLYAFGVI